MRYVVIGAHAFPVHGYARATLDIDFFIEPTPRNAARTLKALRAFGYDTADLSAKDLLARKVLLRQYLVESDFHPFVKGVSFGTAWKNRVKGKIGRTPAFFASLNDLIRMKRAAGRKKDIQDLAALLQLRKKKKAGS